MIVCLPNAVVLEAVGPAPDGVEFVLWNGTGDPPARAGDVEFLVAPYDVHPAPVEMIAALPRLRLVQLLSAGVDAWLRDLPPGVTLCRGAGIHTASTAELAVALALASLRGLPDYVRQQDQQRWEAHHSASLAGRRVLIVGAGDIGLALARRVEAFEAEFTLVARSARGDVRGTHELPTLLPGHDIVMLTVPLTEQTRGLVDRAFLAALPDGALVVNVARGAVVLTEALLAELESGRLRAALDVVDPEPLPADHRLWRAPNLLLSPHVGGGTEGWADRAVALVADQLRRAAAGERPRYVVSGRY